jgi:hypothetical protein
MRGFEQYCEWPSKHESSKLELRFESAKTISGEIQKWNSRETEHSLPAKDRTKYFTGIVRIDPYDDAFYVRRYKESPQGLLCQMNHHEQC